VKLQQILVDWWRESQATIVFVTHNIDEAVVLGSRVVVFRERPGRIAREFTIDLSRPRDRMTNEFTQCYLRIRAALSRQLD